MKDEEKLEKLGYVQKSIGHAIIGKSIPKKPLGISITHDGKVGNCPCCHKFVREIDTIICECGQILYWEK